MTSPASLRLCYPGWWVIYEYIYQNIQTHPALGEIDTILVCSQYYQARGQEEKTGSKNPPF